MMKVKVKIVTSGETLPKYETGIRRYGYTRSANRTCGIESR